MRYIDDTLWHERHELFIVSIFKGRSSFSIPPPTLAFFREERTKHGLEIP